MNDIIKSSLDGIRCFADVNTAMGTPINTPSGVTVIPVSKVTVGFAGGGVDYGAKKLSPTQNFGGGSGTGVSVIPIAFLTVSKDSDIRLIPIDQGEENVTKVLSLIERSPDIIERIKKSLS